MAQSWTLTSLPNGLLLEPHPTARNKVVAASEFREGSIVAEVPSLVTVLLPSEKGRRCDSCFRKASPQRVLRKCTGCAAYWYCGVQCQNLQWNDHHKRLCKRYHHFHSSVTFQSLALHDQLDALLLSHLLACVSADLPSPQDGSPVSTFLSLMPSSNTVDFHLPLIENKVSRQVAGDLYSRFSNNNFVIHSHLTPVGHGIFPLASLLFNHSCYPNAAPKYTFSQDSITMKIVALREMHPGEEICIPYLDPALVQSRQHILEYTYGFRCACFSCEGLLHPLPPNTTSAEVDSSVAGTLRQYIGLDLDQSPITLPEKPKGAIPPLLYSVFQETYLSNISEMFSKSSHDGQYELAVDAGMTLLGAYILIYPPNYPQIGLHLLEMAKTVWNMFMSSGEANTRLKNQAQALLNMSRKILDVYGREGDEDGPLDEAEVLQSILD